MGVTWHGVLSERFKYMIANWVTKELNNKITPTQKTHMNTNVCK